MDKSACAFCPDLNGFSCVAAISQAVKVQGALGVLITNVYLRAAEVMCHTPRMFHVQLAAGSTS